MQEKSEIKDAVYKPMGKAVCKVGEAHLNPHSRIEAKGERLNG
jgi:hypothetical protein